jgi:hypothetical protein
LSPVKVSELTVHLISRQTFTVQWFSGLIYWFIAVQHWGDGNIKCLNLTYTVQWVECQLSVESPPHWLLYRSMCPSLLDPDWSIVGRTHLRSPYCAGSSHFHQGPTKFKVLKCHSWPFHGREKPGLNLGKPRIFFIIKPTLKSGTIWNYYSIGCWLWIQLWSRTKGKWVLTSKWRKLKKNVAFKLYSRSMW